MRPILFAALLALATPALAQPAPTNVQVEDMVVGEGAEVRRGWFAVMHYTGWVFDPAQPGSRGAQFVDSRERGPATSFVYGYNRALRGLEAGMRGMKVGGKRTIVVPASLGYDGFKHPVPKGVPADSALVFEVELLDVVPQGNTD